MHNARLSNSFVAGADFDQARLERSAEVAIVGVNPEEVALNSVNYPLKHSVIIQSTEKWSTYSGYEVRVSRMFSKRMMSSLP